MIQNYFIGSINRLEVEWVSNEEEEERRKEEESPAALKDIQCQT